MEPFVEHFRDYIHVTIIIHHDAIINNYAYNVIHFLDSIYRESLTAVSEARPRPS